MTILFKAFCPFLLVILITIPASLFAGKLSGVATNAQSGKPIASVSVFVKQSEAILRIALTDSLGKYAMDSVPAGSYTVVFSRDAYETQAFGDIYISGLAEKRLDAELTPAAETLEKMVVRAASYFKAADMASSSKIITADELLRAPGALLDVQRVVQQLPSVSSGGDQTNEIVVRGSSPGENLFLLDNIEIPNPNHFANEGSGGGVISLVNPLLVKGLTFCAGAPPAQYGDKASSVLDVRLRDGNNAIVLGGVDAGIAGAGLHMEGPLWGGNNFMLSATRSFLDWVVHSSYNNTATAVPGYWGLQGRVAGGGPAGKWYANGIYGDNDITIDRAKEQLGTRGQTITSGGAVYAGGATVERYLSEHLSGVITISAVGNTFDRLEYTGSKSRDTFYANASREREQTVKTQVAYDFGNANRLIMGAFGKRCDFSIDIGSSPDTLKRYRDDADTLGITVATAAGTEVLAENLRRDAIAYKYGGYASAILRPTQRVKIVPGLRFDGFTENHTLTASPRLSGIFSLTSKCDLTGAVGVQYQQPDYEVLAANPTCPPKRAVTGIAGVEYFFDGPGVQCIFETYYKQYDHMPVDSDIISDKRTLMDSFSVSHGVAAIGRGRSFGIEAFAQKKLTSELSWTASYSLSKATMDDPRTGSSALRCPADFDFGSTVTLSAGWKKELLTAPWYAALRNRTWFKLLSPIMPVADRMEFSVRWRYLGGRPYTAKAYDTTYRRWYVDPAAPLNGRRYPDYHTLDIRWERRFGFGFLQMMYYFDLQNVYGRPNVWQYLFVDGKPSQSVVNQLPFFPAGGMIIGF